VRARRAIRSAWAIGGIAAIAFLGSAPGAAAEPEFLRTWGNIGTGPGQFRLPDGLAVDTGGSVWVADRDNNRIQKFTYQGKVQSFPPFKRTHLTSARGHFNLPYGVAVNGIGELYVADTHNHRIQWFTPAGKLIKAWGRKGKAPGEFDTPRGLTVDVFGNVWVADHTNQRVQKFSYDGRLLGVFGAGGGDGTPGSGPGEFFEPRGMSSDHDGNIYVAEMVNHRVQVLRNDGSFLRAWGKGGTGGYDQVGSGYGEFRLPYQTAVDRQGRVWVTDTDNERVQVFTPEGGFVRAFGANNADGTLGTGPGEFAKPYGAASDCAGNVYITEQENRRVQVFGERGGRPPVCPPRMRIGSVRVARGSVRVGATCDRPCRLIVSGRGGAIRRPAEDVVRERDGGPVTVTARTARRGKATILITAQGAPGAERVVRRRLTLR
jgi:DNA-binding beta-propeller fold protein YncE